MTRFTVIGGAGYVGSHLVAALRTAGIETEAIVRGDDALGAPLGHVINCAAITNDSRSRPIETAQANVGNLAELLAKADFESFLHLSTCQVYVGADRSIEDEPLRIDPNQPSEIYRASKVLGEIVCRASERDGRRVRVARLSAIYGTRLSPGSFLESVVSEAVDRGRIVLRTTLDSARDFFHIDDVTRILPRIAMGGRSALYNVASGILTSNAEVVAALADETGCAVDVAVGAPKESYPPIDVTRLCDEFGVTARPSMVAQMRSIVRDYRASRAAAPR